MSQDTRFSDDLTPNPQETVFADQSPADLKAAEAAVAKEWKVGDIILGLYEVKQVYTSGGMGLVYRVHHRNWNIDLVVKAPRAEFFQTERHKENFVREAETWVNLGLHPHTVSCYYVRDLGGIPRVFAEYVEGGSLSEWIADKRLYEGGQKNALERILDIAIQFAWGLQFAHEQGLVHQDVKPANVMMTSQGIAKVTDFGLAKAKGSVEGQAAPIAGGSVLVASGGLTPAYASPEQASGKQLSRKTDIWSWAVSVLEMFTGEITWMSGEVAPEALEGYLESGAEDKRIPRMPEGVAELLKLCFQFEPAQRPKDMVEVVNELQAVYQRNKRKKYPRRKPEPARNTADSLNNRAASLFDLGKKDEAVKLWEEALRVQPGHAEATYNRGLMLWRAGQITDEHLIREITQIQGNYSVTGDVNYLLAMVHLERDDAQAAIEALEGVQSIDTDKADFKEALTAARRKRLDSEGALHTFKEHTGAVTSVVLSSDNKFALSGSMDKTLKLWDLSSGNCLRTFGGPEGHVFGVSSVCLSTDSKYALSGSHGETMKLWDVSTGACVRTFKGHVRGFKSVSLSKDHKYALSATKQDVTVKLWNVSSGRCFRTFEGHQTEVSSVCFSADGKYALSGSWDKTMKLWNVASGKCLRTFEGHTDQVNSVSLRANGKQALSGSNDKTIKLWDTSSGKCLRTFEGHREHVYAVSLSADGKYALSGSRDKTMKLWDVASGKCLRTFEGHTGYVTSVNISRDGGLVLSGSDDNTLKLWKIGKSEYYAQIAISRVVASKAAIEADAAAERNLALARKSLAKRDMKAAAAYVRDLRALPGYERSPEAVELWSNLYKYLPRIALKGAWVEHTLQGHTETVSWVSLSADGKQAVSISRDGIVNIWDTSTGECQRTFKVPKPRMTLTSNNVFTSDGKYFLLRESGKVIKLWDVSTGNCIQTFNEDAESFCLSADNKYALSGGENGTLKLWDTSSGKCLRTFEGHTGRVESVCLSADSKYALSSSNDRTLKLWDTSSGTCLRPFTRDVVRSRGLEDSQLPANLRGDTVGHMKSVCFSADSRYALSGNGSRLMLWDVASGKCLRTFEGHQSTVSSVCFSADGKYALSGSRDKTMKLWDVASGKCLRTFEGHQGELTSVCFSADGRYALSGSWDKTLNLWQLDWELERETATSKSQNGQPYIKGHSSTEAYSTQYTPFSATQEQSGESPGKSTWIVAGLCLATILLVVIYYFSL